MQPPDWIGRLRKTILNKARSIRSRFRRPKLRLGPLSSLALLVAIAAVPLVAIATTVYCWDWLQGAGESNSATLRNIGLIIAALIALPLALWRSWVAQRQADTAQQSLVNERYQRGAEMLGNSNLSVRLGGIYALQSLAGEHPELYHIQIMRLFCAFVRQTTESEEDTGTEPIIREDIQAVMDAIGFRGKKGISLEKNARWEERFQIDLSAADLRKYNLRGMNLAGAILGKTNLSGAKLTDAKLHGAYLLDADMSGAILFHATLSKSSLLNAKLPHADLSYANLKCARLGGANLSDATLYKADLTGAYLLDANLSGVKLVVEDMSSGEKIPATGLTQAEFDKAVADPDNPPRLDPAVIDAETGKPLVWRGKRPGNH